MRSGVTSSNRRLVRKCRTNAGRRPAAGAARGPSGGPAEAGTGSVARTPDSVRRISSRPRATQSPLDSRTPSTVKQATSSSSRKRSPQWLYAATVSRTRSRATSSQCSIGCQSKSVAFRPVAGSRPAPGVGALVGGLGGEAGEDRDGRDEVVGTADRGGVPGEGVAQAVRGRAIQLEVAVLRRAQPEDARLRHVHTRTFPVASPCGVGRRAPAVTDAPAHSVVPQLPPGAQRRRCTAGGNASRWVEEARLQRRRAPHGHGPTVSGVAGRRPGEILDERKRLIAVFFRTAG